MRLLLALALLLCPLLAQAQAEAVIVSPYSSAVTGVAPGGGLQTAVTYEARAASTAANSMYFQRGLTAARSTVANGVRSRFAVGPALVTAGVILAAGWALDELTGQIQSTPAAAGVSCGAGAAFFYETAYGHTACSAGGIESDLITTLQETASPGSAQASTYKVSGSTPAEGASTLWVFYGVGEIRIYHIAANGLSHTDPGSAGVAATDNELAQLIENNPSTWPETFHWPNGSPQVLPEMAPQMAAVQDQYRADTGLAPKPVGDPEPVPAPEPNIDPAPSTAPDPAGSSSPGQPTLAFPAFCTWAPFLCDEGSIPDDVPLPEVDVPVTSTPFVSGLGDGSCPPPVTLTVSLLGTDAPIAFEYDPLCQFVLFLAPMTNIMALLVAAFILAGKGMRRAG